MVKQVVKVWMPTLAHSKLHYHQQKHRHPTRSIHLTGFTLLEVMVVVVIMAMLVGLISINSRPDPERSLRQQAERLAQHLILAQQESVLHAQPIAWIANGTHYRFIVRHAGQWQYLDQMDSTTKDTVFAPQTWQTSLSDIRVTGLMLPTELLQQGVLAGNTASLLGFV